MNKNPETIKKDVVDSLYWDDRIDASSIEVKVEDDGTVQLEGKVPNYTARSNASIDAWLISGVKKVENDIEVEFPETLTVPTDEEIKSNIENVLFWNPSISSDDIEVEVTAGIVTLSGDVEAYWKLIKTEELASNVSGVIDVVNKITVVPTKKIVDEAIAEDIVNALDRNVNVNVDDINVKVENGDVTLSGTVPNWYAYDAARDAALFTVGVKNLRDNLMIKSS